jgi:hypothetical protein
VESSDDGSDDDTVENIGVCVESETERERETETQVEARGIRRLHMLRLSDVSYQIHLTPRS